MKKLFLVISAATLLTMVVFFVPTTSRIASAHTTHATQVQTQSSKTIAADISVYIWGTNVNARYSSPLGIGYPSCYYYPSTSCPSQGQFTKEWVTAICQQQGQTITAEGYTNNWWSLVYGFGSQEWVSNIYIQGGQTIAGEPYCNR